MEFEEMSIEEAIEHLELEIEETSDGSRLLWGPEHAEAGQEVTLSKVSETLVATEASWAMIQKTLSNNGESVKEFFSITIRSLSAITNQLDKEAKQA